MTPEEYIKERVDDQAAWFSQKSQYNQKLFKRLRVAEVIFATAIPFLSGHISDGDVVIKIVIGLFGAAIAIISGLLAIYKFQENWIQYRTICEALKREKLLFLTRTSPYDKQEPYPIFVKNIESLLSKENIAWASYIAKDSEGKKQ